MRDATLLASRLPHRPGSPPPTEIALATTLGKIGRALTWLAAVLVLGATLVPSRSEVEGAFFDCLVCGDRGLADAILNVALFVPFGAAAALVTRSWRRAVLYAVVLSTSVELAQQGIPGRHPSGGDLLFNSLGAVLGVLLVATSDRWILPRAGVSARLSCVASVLLVAMVAITGWLFSPALPQTSYFVQWTPRLAHLAPYDGKVSASSLGSTPHVPGELEDSRQFQRSLERGDELRIGAIAGRHPGGLASLFSIHDEHRQEVLLLGPDHEDFVLRVRSHARRLRLDQADMRASFAMRDIAHGDSLDVRVRLGKGAHCLAINDHSSCSYGFTAARGWAVLFYAEWLPRWGRGALDMLWMSVFCFPIGWWARGRKETGAAVLIAAAGLLVVPAFAQLLPTATPGFAGAIAGVLGGMLAARVARRQAPGAKPDEG